MPEPGQFDGRVVMVTGASRGLGREIAERFAAAGAAVAAVDLKPHWAEATAAAITAAGGRSIGIGADVADRDAVHRAAASAATTFGGLDILVNNAAWNRYELLDAITPETFDRIFRVGLAGMVWGMQAAAPLLRARGGGAIVNIGSMAGRLGSAGSILYSAVKAGVDGLTRAASVELGGDRIRVNTVAPATVATEAVRAMLTPEMFARRVAATPLGRLGEAGDIAAAVLWLASDAAAFVTGQSLAVDGGLGHALAR